MERGAPATEGEYGADENLPDEGVQGVMGYDERGGTGGLVYMVLTESRQCPCASGSPTLTESARTGDGGGGGV